MKTPEEIVYALGCLGGGKVCSKCAYQGINDCSTEAEKDATELICKLQDENRALRTELTVNSGDYWKNICRLNARQEAKGMEKYGEPLEQNTTLTTTQRIEHAQEEAIDLLKYLEHLKKTVDGDGITANDFQRAALRTANGANCVNLMNAALGMAGESGEVADIVKKHSFQGHGLDISHVAEELGDVLWYVAVGAEAIGLTLGEVAQRNIEKLKSRYPDGFDKARSIHREEAHDKD